MDAWIAVSTWTLKWREFNLGWQRQCNVNDVGQTRDYIENCIQSLNFKQVQSIFEGTWNFKWKLLKLFNLHFVVDNFFPCIFRSPGVV